MSAPRQRLTRVVIAAAALAACAGERTQGPVVGRAVIRARTTTLAVGDTQTLNAGLLLNDGRFVPFDSVEFFSESPTKASIDRYSGVMRGLEAGSAIIRTDVPNEAVTLDTILTVVP